MSSAHRQLGNIGHRDVAVQGSCVQLQWEYLGPLQRIGSLSSLVAMHKTREGLVNLLQLLSGLTTSATPTNNTKTMESSNWQDWFFTVTRDTVAKIRKWETNVQCLLFTALLRTRLHIFLPWNANWRLVINAVDKVLTYPKCHRTFSCRTLRTKCQDLSLYRGSSEAYTWNSKALLVKRHGQ